MYIGGYLGSRAREAQFKEVRGSQTGKRLTASRDLVFDEFGHVMTPLGTETHLARGSGSREGQQRSNMDSFPENQTQKDGKMEMC